MQVDQMDVMCAMVEIQYTTMMKQSMDMSELSESQIREILYPSEWSFMTGEFKLKALKEALDNQQNLNDTDCVKAYYGRHK